MRIHNSTFHYFQIRIQNKPEKQLYVCWKLADNTLARDENLNRHVSATDFVQFKVAGKISFRRFFLLLSNEQAHKADAGYGRHLSQDCLLFICSCELQMNVKISRRE